MELKKELQIIERVAKEKAEEIEKANYEKYINIYNLAYKFLKTQKVLLYGGLAVHELLYPKYKIYPEYSLPDIDIFTTDSEKICKLIIKFYKLNGYKIVNYSEALHEGTYKVYVDGNQVLDVTQVSKEAFKKLSQNTKKIHSGIRLVNKNFLRLSLHMMLSQSNDAYRWSKVYERLMLFYKVFPPNKCDFLDSRQNSLNPLHETCLKIFENKQFVLFGQYEISKLINRNIKFRKSLSPFQILAHTNIIESAEEIVNNIIDYNNTFTIEDFKISDLFNYDDFISDHIIIYYKDSPLITIYYTESCMTYNIYNKLRIATFPTIITMYLSMSLSLHEHFNKNISCIIESLSYFEYKLKNSHKLLYKKFIKECYGSYKGLLTLKKERLLRLLNKK